MSREFIETSKKLQTTEKESSEEINTIREALIEGEKSGFDNKSIEDIWNEAKKQYTKLKAF